MPKYIPRRPWEPSPAMLQYLQTLTGLSARMRALAHKARAAAGGW